MVAIIHEEPILFIVWHSHEMFLNYDLKGLDDAQTYWKRDDYYLGVNSNFKDKSPDMHNFVKILTLILKITKSSCTVSMKVKIWMTWSQTRLKKIALKLMTGLKNKKLELPLLII